MTIEALSFQPISNADFNKLKKNNFAWVQGSAQLIKNTIDGKNPDLTIHGSKDVALYSTQNYNGHTGTMYLAVFQF